MRPRTVEGGAEPGWYREVLEVQRRSADMIPVYSRLAHVYELIGRFESRARRRTLELAAVEDGIDVLEVATGTGVQLVALAERNPSGTTVGVDLADGMLAKTRHRLAAARRANPAMRGARVEVQKANALALPFPDESFDLVVSSFMLDLLAREEIPRAVAELKRVLRRRGRVVIAGLTKGERPWQRTWDFLYRCGIPFSFNCRGLLMVPILGDLGFADIRRDFLSQMLVPFEIVAARKT